MVDKNASTDLTLPQGHTHEDVDRWFGEVAEALRREQSSARPTEITPDLTEIATTVKPPCRV